MLKYSLKNFEGEFIIGMVGIGSGKPHPCMIFQKIPNGLNLHERMDGGEYLWAEHMHGSDIHINIARGFEEKPYFAGP